MLAVRVDIIGDSRYKFDRNKVREAVRRVLGEHGVKGQVELSVSVVGRRKMSLLHEKYLKIKGPTDVMSWPLDGANYPDDVLRLGDVVICYPVAVKEAREEGVLVDEKIGALVEHGCLHLLGIHHDGD